MFARKKWIRPNQAQDPSKAINDLGLSIDEYFRSLEGKDALAIVQEGKWTPVLTFATAGDLSVTYTTQYGYYWLLGNQLTLQFAISTSAFTHTTASGNLNVTGIPLASENTTGKINVGSCYWGGITKANYTQVVPRVLANVSYIDFIASGSGQAQSLVTASDMPTGGSVVLNGNITYSVS